MSALQPAGKSKLVRARPAIIRSSNGEIYVPCLRIAAAYPWVDGYVSEHVQFTGLEEFDAHDDQVDCTAYFVQECDKGGMLMPSIVNPSEIDRQISGMRMGNNRAEDIFMD